MDIALKTLVLIIFVLIPGFLFRRTYFQGGFSKQYDSKSWSHSLFYSVLFGLILNWLAVLLYPHFYNQIKLPKCIEFYKTIAKDDLPSFAGNELTNISNFLLILYPLSFLFALTCYEVVRNFKIDRHFESLRFNNHWHYYFRGEAKDFKEFSTSKGKCNCVNVDILAKSDNDGNNLYTGLLSTYSLGTDGSLEAIYLTQAQIYDRTNKKFKDIRSSVFIMPNSNILNINLNYNFEDEDTTTIDFIFLVLFFASAIYVFWDYHTIFSKFPLIAKIVIKFVALFFLTAFNLFLNETFRLALYDAKPQNTEQITDKQKELAIATNKSKKDKQMRIVKNIYNYFGICLAFLLIFIALYSIGYLVF